MSKFKFHLHRLAILLLAGLFLSVGLPLHASVQDKIEQDFAFWGAIYDFHQGNYLSSLVGFPKNTNEPKTLLHKAKALVRFGLPEEARSILERLVKNHGGLLVAEAAFELGRLEYHEGNYDKALDAFKRINGLDKRLLPIYRRYHAATLIAKKDYVGAAKLAAKMDESIWTGYAYQNLAYTYYAKDTDASKALVTLRIADALNIDNQFPEEQKELGSLIHLAAGQMAIDSGDYDKAISFLDKVNLDSSAAPKALYLHGLAHSKKGRYRQAIQSWYRVKKYPLVEDGVADAFMGLAYGFAKDGNISKSIRSYLEAISVLDKEVRTIDTIIRTVKKIGAVNSLLRESTLDHLEWFLADSIATNTPKVAYVNYLVTDRDILKQVEQIAEIDVMIDNLSIWEHDLTVFNKMLESRIEGFKHGAKAAQKRAKNNVIQRLKSQRDALKQELQKAEEENNFLTVADIQLQREYTAVSKQRKKYDELTQKGVLTAKEASDFKERIDRLTGALLWQAKEKFDANRNNLEREFASLDKEIKRYETNLIQFNNVIDRGPGEFNIKLQKNRIEQKKTSNFLVKAKALLKDLDRAFTKDALERLEEKRLQINNRYEKVQLALANMYEELAIAQYEREEKERKIREAKRKAEAEARRQLEQKRAKASGEVAQ